MRRRYPAEVRRDAGPGRGDCAAGVGSLPLPSPARGLIGWERGACCDERDSAASWLSAGSPDAVAQLADQADRAGRSSTAVSWEASGAETQGGRDGREQRQDQLAAAHDQLARLAASSYGQRAGPGPRVLRLGDPQQVLGRSATIEYLARQQDAREQRLHQLALAAQDAQQPRRPGGQAAPDGPGPGGPAAGQAPAGPFHPESPVIGDSITPRMRARCETKVDLGGSARSPRSAATGPATTASIRSAGHAPRQ